MDTSIPLPNYNWLKSPLLTVVLRQDANPQQCKH